MKKKLDNLEKVPEPLPLALQQLCQQMQDEQGFLIIACLKRYEIGDVLTGAGVPMTEGRPLLPPLKVIGYSTAAAYKRQHLKYDPQRRAFWPVPYTCYLKVVAE